MKNIYLIFYSKENLGDDLFVDILLKKYPHCNFFTNSVKQTNTIYSSNTNIFFTNLKYSDLNVINIKNFDAVLYIGGSIFMEHAGGINRIQSLIDLSQLTNSLNIPLFFLSSNFGPYKTEKYKKATEILFCNCYDVCFRDKYSYNLFKHIPSVRYAPDLVFNLEHPTIEHSTKKVGINVLSFKFREPLESIKDSYFNTLLSTIKELINNNFDVTLISFCKYEGDEESISIILNSLDTKYKDKISVLLYDGNLDSFISHYSNFDYMLCSRFHSMILSCLFNQKMYVLSYSSKLDNVISDLYLLPKFHQISNIKNIPYVDITEFCSPCLDYNIIKNCDNQLRKLDTYLKQY